LIIRNTHINCVRENRGKMQRNIKIVSVALLAALTLSACSSNDKDENLDTPIDAVEQTDSNMGSDNSNTDGSDMAMAATVVDLALGNENLTTLVAALQAAGLVETLQGAGPFTVFAPNNEAFAALPAGVLEALLLPENKDTLVKILTYHVLPGNVKAADVRDGDVASVQGGTVKLGTMNGVTVNNANVVNPDNSSNNGVVHIIDAVILPSDVDLSLLLNK
jgi:uncharacterized surface protein with fasciclin (FAS1) repeats